MASAFPHHTPVDHTPRERTDLVVERDGPIDALQTLSCETAQEILGALGDDPRTASELADAVDTSLQNVQYHLDRLGGADLIEPVGTWYSSRGAEMTVYALTAEELRIQLGGDDR